MLPYLFFVILGGVYPPSRNNLKTKLGPVSMYILWKAQPFQSSGFWDFILLTDWRTTDGGTDEQTSCNIDWQKFKEFKQTSI